MKWHRACLVVVLPLSLGFLAGCPWSPRPDPPDPDPDDPVPTYLAQSSPANVMANLKAAYTSRDVEEYRKLFATDFRFVFNPLDVIDPDDPTPTSWGLAEELESTTNMFHNDRVDRIALDYNQGLPEPADSVTFGSRAWRMQVDSANLSIDTRNDKNEPLTYFVPGATEIFYLREVPGVLASDGKPTWFIFQWEDQPIGTARKPGISWGRLKNR